MRTELNIQSGEVVTIIGFDPTTTKPPTAGVQSPSLNASEDELT